MRVRGPSAWSVRASATASLGPVTAQTTRQTGQNKIRHQPNRGADALLGLGAELELFVHEYFFCMVRKNVFLNSFVWIHR